MVFGVKPMASVSSPQSIKHHRHAVWLRATSVGYVPDEVSPLAKDCARLVIRKLAVIAGSKEVIEVGVASRRRIANMIGLSEEYSIVKIRTNNRPYHGLTFVQAFAFSNFGFQLRHGGVVRSVKIALLVRLEFPEEENRSFVLRTSSAERMVW
jgi:hypothetical protein